MDTLCRLRHHRGMMRLVLPFLLLMLLAGCTVPANRPAADEPALADLTQRTAIRRLLREGKPDLALLQVEPLLAHRPGDPELNDLAGQALIASGEPQKALAHFERALQRRPNDPDLLVNLGVALCRTGRREEAERTFVQAAARPGMKHADIALINAGLCAREAGDAARAGRYFRAALQANPRSPAALYHLARQALVEGRPQQARTYILRYQAIGPKTPKSLLLTWLIGKASGDQVLQQQAAEALMTGFGDSEEAAALREGTAAALLGLKPEQPAGAQQTAQPPTTPAPEVLGAMLQAPIGTPPSPPAREEAKSATPEKQAATRAAGQPRRIEPAPPAKGDDGQADRFPGEAWLNAQPDQHWTLQLAASPDLKALTRLRRRLDPQGSTSALFPFRRNGQTLHGLVLGSFPSRPAALAARAGLPERYRQAWPRRFLGIRERIRAYRSAGASASSR